VKFHSNSMLGKDDEMVNKDADDDFNVFNYGNVYTNNPSSKPVDFNIPGCFHDWEKYVGFTEVYYYCKKCDEKSFEDRTLPVKIDWFKG